MHRNLRFMSSLFVATLLAGALLLALHLQTLAQTDTPATLPGQTSLRINELMADNKLSLVDPDEPDETPDWIEIYNSTGSPVSLTGLALTDDGAVPNKHVITDGLTIPANGYLVFFADNDPRQGPLHLNFALSNNGESVVLFDISDPNNIQEIDGVDFPALETDESFGRLPDGSGEWQKLARPTPGKRNDSDPPWITQVTTPTVPAPVELKMTVNATITDTSAVVTATLHYSVADGSWQTTTMNFVGGDLYAGDIPPQPADTLVSYYVRAVDDQDEVTRFPLPKREYRYLTGYTPPVVLVNEIVVFNNSVPDPDEPAEFPDWIELYNPGNAPVSLNGLSLTDDKSNPVKFMIPDGLTIPAKSLLLFLADSDPGQGPTHLNFNLNADGDYVALRGGSGTVLIDAYDIDQRPMLGAIGRVPDGGAWSEQVCPTFGTSNLLCDKTAFLPVAER